MPIVDVGDAVLRYQVEGDGPAALLLHGGGNNHLIWWRVVPRLATEWTVITPDVRGHGWSTCAPDDADPACHPDDLQAVLDHAGVDRIRLVCHSMAGVAGLRFTTEHPDRVVSLALIASPAVRTPRTVGSFQRVEDILGRSGSRQAMIDRAFAPGAVDRIPEHAYLYRRLNALNPPFPGDILMPGLRRMVVPAGDLDGYDTPTLVTVGQHDQMLEFDTIAEVARLIPGADFAVHDAAGHSPMIEDPDAFVDVVGGWLRKHD